MIKKISITILLLLLIPFSGCQAYYINNDSSEIKESSSSDNSSQSKTATDQYSIQEHEEIVDTISTTINEVNDFLKDKEPITFQSDKEDNIYYSMQGFVSSENGFYFLKGTDSVHVWFYDIESGKASILCSRSDCDHGKNCDAYRGKDIYYTNAIYFYNEKLYMIANSDNGGYLESWNADGSNYKRVVKLWDKNKFCIDAEGVLERIVIIHNDYIYYLVFNDNSNTTDLCRVSLDGSKNQEIFTSIDTDTQELLSQDLYANGNNIYLVRSRLKHGAQIYKYSIDSNLSELVYEGISSTILGICFIDDFMYLYENKKGLIRMNTLTNESELIMESPYFGNFQISYDGNFLYVNNFVAYMSAIYRGAESVPEDLKLSVIVMDKDGKIVDTIVFQGEVERIMFGDSRYMVVVQEANENVIVDDSIRLSLGENKYVTIYDKRLIGSGLCLWHAVAGWTFFRANTY